MKFYGRWPEALRATLAESEAGLEGLRVRRRNRARSKTPFPGSEDLERAIVGRLEGEGFSHHQNLYHPRTGSRFEYDFYREIDSVALEVMGYRADDEVYKDLLKFHVHEGTRFAWLMFPRWKWISNKRTEVNFRAAIKALEFAEDFIDVEGSAASAYDWEPVPGEPAWLLRWQKI